MTVKAGIVCGNCEWLNTLASTSCEDCGHELALLKVLHSPGPPTGDTTEQLGDVGAKAEDSPPPAAQQGAEEEPMEQARHYICKSCYSPVPTGHKFCGKCGTPVPEESAVATDPSYFGDMQTPGKAKLILIKGEGMDGISYHLNSTEHVAGRVEGPILFTEDKWLSPKHANFVYEDGKLLVRDEGSTNGVFIALRGDDTLKPGSVFMAGEQLFRVEEVGAYSDEAEADGTYFFASPRAEASFRVVQILEGGGDGMVVHAKENEVVIGREACDMNFPNDPYISGQHVKVALSGGSLVLVDMDSKNGTYIKVDKNRELTHGDYIFLGRQLLRVEITP
jgi:pSer/pThr/pTyr-binding forkhead associated (FHA) protein/ribosomal protein L40E